MSDNIAHIYMINFTCPICKSENCKKLEHRKPYNIIKCNNCDLFFTYPLPKLQELYDYYQGIEHNIIPDYRFEEWRKVSGHHMEQMLDVVNQIPGADKGNKFLEVGCGLGFHLKKAKEIGWKEWGLDLDKKAVDKARSKLGINVRSCDLIDANFPKNFFTVVLARDVIEHLPDPIGFLQEVNRIMKKNGVLILQTPNSLSIDCFLDPAKLISRYKQIGKIHAQKPVVKRIGFFFSRAWSFMNPPYHLYCFSSKNLKLMLEMTGFQVSREFSPFCGDKNLDPMLIRVEGLLRFFELTFPPILATTIAKVPIFKGKGRSILVFAKKSCNGFN